ncbi:hypothetical protein [Cupriavidus pauculus]|uniref:SMP-30/Gluconolactonase/LRE-like region domain-containing protein n=1 Tax=Cupriavidus pauculus TaxID=82633 RepID=A0A2N5CBC9_9BURK|nr:hypothetical protein [Cupriavidus pauculus]PLP99523.1 hypothetical protein CYJ10_17085 [Cupriavidus pauculus]
MTTLAGGTNGSTDGTGASAKFQGPFGVAVDGAGNVYVGDSQNNLIRKVTSAGVVTTLVDGLVSGPTNGSGTTARFDTTSGLAVGAAGDLYIADCGNNPSHGRHSL